MKTITCTIQNIQAAVDKFVRGGKTFSAYDVVKFLRERKYFATRANVNPIVHQHMDALIKTNATYSMKDNGRYIEYTPCTVQITKPTPKKTVVNTTPKSVLGTVNVGSEGRINLSKAFMNAISVLPNQNAFVMESNGKITVKPIGSSSDRKIKTDNHNNLRIRTKNTKSTYSVAKNGGYLELS